MNPEEKPASRRDIRREIIEKLAETADLRIYEDGLKGFEDWKRENENGEMASVFFEWPISDGVSKWIKSKSFSEAEPILSLIDNAIAGNDVADKITVKKQGSVEIILPPTVEQHRIAEALQTLTQLGEVRIQRKLKHRDDQKMKRVFSTVQWVSFIIIPGKARHECFSFFRYLDSMTNFSNPPRHASLCAKGTFGLG
jgi:hypothetical protein